MKKTLRDEMAIAFITAILQSDRFLDYTDEVNIMDAIAKDAYLMADALVLNRSKGTTNT